MQIDKKSLKTLQEIYADFKRLNSLSAAEYLEQTNLDLSAEETAVFLQIAKHQAFLENLVTDFLAHLNPGDKPTAEVLTFLVLFLLNEDNLDTILECFIQIDSSYVCDLLGALADASRHLKVCQTACKYFADDYVLEQIMDPFLNRTPTIIQLGKKYLIHYQIKQVPVTQPKPFSFMMGHYRRQLIPPANTPAAKRKFRASKVPDTTYTKDKRFDRRMAKLKDENHRKAKQLVLEASRISERLVQSKLPPEPEHTPPETLKPKPAPIFKPVEIRGNLTTTLREASRLAKIQKEEVNKIDDLIKGGCSPEDIEELEEQLREENDLKQLEAIERNHLKGLLSHEEAALAKCKLMEETKIKMEEFKQQKVEWLQALDRWRKQEELKIRQLVNKSQTIKQNAKESERKMLEQKQQNVRVHQLQTRRMLEQAVAERNKELARKIDLIHEIKALHRVRCNIKEFDPTETPNLGLLCEMSIAELQERLAIARLDMQKELEKKRLNILKKKEEHKVMVENLKELIAEGRRRVKAPPKKSQPEIVDSPELEQLRRQLDEKRKLRDCSRLVT